MITNNFYMDLSRALRNKIPQIISEWEQRIRAALIEARNEPTFVLHDHVPDLLNSLADIFESQSPQKEETKSSNRELGRIHGEQRALKTGYSINGLMLEYTILRQVILDELHETGLLNFQNSKILHLHLDEAIQNAVSEFVKQQSSQYKEITNKLDLVFNETPAQMAIWTGEDLVFDMTNPAYEKLFGNRSLKGRKLLEAIPEIKDQPFVDILKNVLRIGVPYIGHEEMAQIKTVEGGPLEDHYFDYGYFQLKDTKGNPFGVYAHSIDVTERVMARKNKEKKSEELAKTIDDLAREKSIHERFVLALTHDLRTPLTAAKMGAQLLIRKPNDTDLILKHLPRIQANLERIDNMVRDLLDASQIKAGGKIQLEFSECHLNPLIQETISDLTTIHGSRFRVEGDAGIEGKWECTALRRILENLCSNAIKYGSKYEPVIIKTKLNSSSATIIVNNKGDPIPDDGLEKLFRIFHRSESAKFSGKKGWGIGLMLVKGLVAAHNGTIEVVSNLENGTSFIVTLPLDPLEID